MDAEDAKEFVRHCLGLWRTQAGIGELAGHVAPDYVRHTAIGETLPWEPIAQGMSALAHALTDGRMEIQHMIAEGDLVAVAMTMEGTHSGDFLGIAPTGRRFTWSGMYHCRIADGKIAEDWGVFLAIAFPRQLRMIMQQAATT